MNNTIIYKGYIGSVEFSETDRVFHGKVQGIRSLVSYEGSNADELINDFHEAVDDYLDMCQMHGITPEVAFKGCFSVRLRDDLHKRAAIYAINHGQSLNRFVEDAVADRLTAVGC